jgi:glutathione synthase
MTWPDLQDILSAYETMTGDELSAYILMEKIFPPPQPSTFIRRGVVTEAMSVCELGIYSVFLFSEARQQQQSEDSAETNNQPISQIHLNDYSGYLLRVKAESVTEGGVAAGYSVLSSVHLQN